MEQEKIQVDMNLINEINEAFIKAGIYPATQSLDDGKYYTEQDMRNCFKAARKQKNGDYESGQRDTMAQVNKYKSFKDYLKTLNK